MKKLMFVIFIGLTVFYAQNNVIAQEVAKTELIKEIIQLRDSLTKIVLNKLEKITPQAVRVNATNDPEGNNIEFGMIFNQNDVSGSQTLEQYYGNPNEQIYFARWYKLDGTLVHAGSISYSTPYKRLQYMANCNGRKHLLRVRNGDNFSETEIEFPTDSTIVNASEAELLLVKNTIIRFFQEQPVVKTIKKDSEAQNAELKKHLSVLKIEKAPNSLGDAGKYFKLGDSLRCGQKVSWASLLDEALECLAYAKKPGKAFHYLEPTCAYNSTEEKQFSKHVNSIIKTEMGRNDLWGWIKPYVETVIKISPEISQYFCNLLDKLLEFDYIVEKQYYEKCKKEGNEGNFIRINPKTKEYDWDRRIIAYFYRRVADNTLTTANIKQWAQKTKTELSL